MTDPAPVPPARLLVHSLALVAFCGSSHGLLAAACDAQGPPTLVADLATNGTPDSSPGFGRTATSIAVFAATTGNLGRELYRLDRATGSAVLIKDIRPGDGGSDPAGFVELFGITYFAATTEAHGRELWRTDGTEGGTYLVADLRPLQPGSEPTDLCVIAGKLVFRAFDRIYESDGTAAGTARVAGSGSLTKIGPLTAGGPFGAAFVVFAADDGLHGQEPWSYDGTTVASLGDVLPGPFGSNPSGFATGGTLGTRIAFSADDGVGREPWSVALGGTAAKLATVNPSPGGSMPAHLAVSGLFRAPELVSFSADDGAGRELWVADVGTSTATRVDLGPGAAEPVGMIWRPDYASPTFGSFLFFADDGTGKSLWGFDGVSAARLFPAPLDGDGFLVESPVLGSPRIVFAGDDGATGDEVWTTDGTVTGTRLLAEVAPGPLSSLESRTSLSLVASGPEVIVSANDGVTGAEPWVLHPVGGVWRASALGDLAKSTQASSHPALLDQPGIERPDFACFAVDDPVSGRELAVITAAGTSVLDLNPGPGSSNPEEITLVTRGISRRIYFEAFIPGADRELYCSDGTVAGTSVVVDLSPGGFQTLVGERLVDARRGLFYFVPTAILRPTRIYVHDGTNATELVAPVGSYERPQQLRLLDDGTVLFFAATRDPSGNSLGVELWKTDGTSAGTQFVRDVRVGAFNSPYVAAVPDLDTSLGDRALFVLNDGKGAEVWASDGTSAGTVQVSSIGGTPPRILARLGEGLLFAAGTFTTGQELWFTRGTSRSTRQVLELVPGKGDGDLGAFAARSMARTPEHAYFTADTGSGRALWVTDGLAAGTKPIAGAPVPLPAKPWVATSDGASHALFNADDGVTGEELWVTDGISAQLLADLHPGPRPSSPSTPVLAGSQWLFAADDGTSGMELWAARTMAGFVRLELPCTASGTALPRLSMPAPPALGSLTAFEFAGETSQNPALLLLSPFELKIEAFGCPFPFVVIDSIVLPPDTPVSWRLPLFIPSSSSLLGARLTVQGLEIDAAGPSLVRGTDRIVIILG